MFKVREILRLKFEVDLSLREIGQICGCGKSTVSAILDRVQQANLSWPISLNDKQLMSLLYPPGANKCISSQPDMEYIFREMKKKNVTLLLLWEEYKRDHPDGIMYSQFCERYRQFKSDQRLTLHKEHKAGEEAETDWAGSTLPYTNRHTGEMKPAFLFVAVLPASAYPFAYAYPHQKMSSWIDAHIRMYEFFGGVPKFTISDNTKTAVSKPDRFDPVLNRTYQEMAQHYHTTLMPTRARKPKDKGADENMVLQVSRRILAALRNRQFFSLQEVNQAVQEELNKLICRPFQRREGNRKLAFEQIDQPCLQPLPVTKYEYAEWKETRVGFNYHVEYEGFFYSVSYALINQICSIRATMNTIEIFVDHDRVAAYPRNYNTTARYQTLPDHMPENHKAVYDWNPDRFLSWASKIGSSTKDLISRVLESREYPVQTYRTCMGIMRLAEQYGTEVMESASQEALEKQVFSFKYISLIAKQRVFTHSSSPCEKIIRHENIRGHQPMTAQEGEENHV